MKKMHYLMITTLATSFDPCSLKKILALSLGIGCMVQTAYAGGFRNAMTLVAYYADTDNDGFGDAANSVNAPSPPAGYVTNSDDCNDSDSTIHPDATEVCNETDDDCDGLVDEGVQTTYMIDFDGDGNLNPYVTILACTAPLGWWPEPGGYYDCNDSDEYVGSGACGGFEVCNGIDDDGNGLIDTDDPGLVSALYWYADSDGDGLGDPNTSVYACTQPSGYVPWPNNSDPCPNDPLNVLDGDGNCGGCSGDDSDCDGIADDCDLCPGGDDSMDFNEDGIADCSQLLNYNDYSPDWYCDNNKIHVCHNENNLQTICIDSSALPAHYAHSDRIGPCTSCPQNLIRPGNPDPGEGALQFMLTEQGDPESNVSWHPFNNPLMDRNEDEVFRVVPNPADDHIKIQTNFFPGVISVMKVSGKIVYRQIISGQINMIQTGYLANGIYFIRLENEGTCFIKSIVIIH